MPLNPAMEARQKLADMAKAQNDYKARDRNGTRTSFDADAMAGAARTERSKYLAAKATLEGVEPQVAMFNAIKLKLVRRSTNRSNPSARRWRRY